MRNSMLAGLLAFLMVGLSLTSPYSGAWDATVTFQAPLVASGHDAAMSVSVRNTWVREIRLMHVNLSTDWPGGPENLSASGTPSGLPPGNSVFFQWIVSVPAALEDGSLYHARVDIDAREYAEDGHLLNVSTSHFWVFNMTIRSGPNTNDSGNGTTTFLGITLWSLTGFLCAGLLLLVALLVLLLIIRVFRPRNRT